MFRQHPKGPVTVLLDDKPYTRASVEKIDA